MFSILIQYSGPSKDALAYVEWLREDHRFSDILVQISPASNGHAFPKLKLRYKPSLVQASYMTAYWFPVHFGSNLLILLFHKNYSFYTIVLQAFT